MNKSPLLAVFITLVSADVVAQEDFFESSMHSAGLSVGIIDHRYTGDADIAGGISYQGPAFGLSYTGPQLRATGLFTRFDDKHTLINLSGIGWLLPSFTLKRLNNTILAVPIGALAAWLRTSGDDDIAPLGTQAILLGAGGVLEHQIGSRTGIKLRAMPLAGFTSTELTDALGLSWAADAEARLEVNEIFSSMGLTISYIFRYQVWNVNGSRVLSSVVDEAYDYTSAIHMISVELNF
ncbi:MAG: hypothetical protein OXI44_07125 [Bacteroidota bacterium]|nr:hypothetical protein [Bacteroidota bacterium]